ncbi:MAG: hypothetical protein ACK55Z_29850, partial [bacterium]
RRWQGRGGGYAELEQMRRLEMLELLEVVDVDQPALTHRHDHEASARLQQVELQDGQEDEDGHGRTGKVPCEPLLPPSFVPLGRDRQPLERFQPQVGPPFGR